MASVNDQVKGNHFDKFCKKSILVDRSGNAYGLSNLGLPGNVFSTTVTFDGNTGTGGVGDYDGSGNPVTLANVTGLIGANVIGLCIGTVTGTGASVRVGVTSDNDAFIGSTGAETIDPDEFWTVSSQTKVLGSTALVGVTKIIHEDITLTAAAANVSGGSIKFFIFWEPLSDDATVTR